MAAKTKDELTVATKALDRVLRPERFWVPQWYKNSHTVAYYDMYEHPETLPPYALGETGVLVVQRRKGRGAEGQRARLTDKTGTGRDVGRLYPSPAAAGDPDAVRDHGDQLHADPVRARRPDRTDAGPAGRRGRRDPEPWRGDGGDAGGGERRRGLCRRARPAARVPRQAGGAVRLCPHRLRRGLHRRAVAEAPGMPERDDPGAGTLPHHDVATTCASTSAKATSGRSRWSIWCWKRCRCRSRWACGPR